MTSPLPVSGLLAWWGTAWLRAQAAPDDVIDAVHDGGMPHTVSGLAEEPLPLLLALPALRERGATTLGAAFPAEGDPVGLGGPAPFNTAALEAGEAVVCAGSGLGLTPRQVGPSHQWLAHDASRRQIPDVGEADRGLRSALLVATDLLAGLEVARWRPEVADELIDLGRPVAVPAPPGVPGRCADLAARGLQALGIARLALADDGGAVTAAEAGARRAAILPLDRAARRALTAACSPEVWPPT